MWESFANRTSSKPSAWSEANKTQHWKSFVHSSWSLQAVVVVVVVALLATVANSSKSVLDTLSPELCRVVDTLWALLHCFRGHCCYMCVLLLDSFAFSFCVTKTDRVAKDATRVSRLKASELKPTVGRPFDNRNWRTVWKENLCEGVVAKLRCHVLLWAWLRRNLTA